MFCFFFLISSSFYWAQFPIRWPIMGEPCVLLLVKGDQFQLSAIQNIKHVHKQARWMASIQNLLNIRHSARATEPVTSMFSALRFCLFQLFQLEDIFESGVYYVVYNYPCNLIKISRKVHMKNGYALLALTLSFLHFIPKLKKKLHIV